MSAGLGAGLTGVRERMWACEANADADDLTADDAVLVGGVERRTIVVVAGRVIGGVIN